MTVYSTAALTLAIIQVPYTQSPESNAMIEPIHCLIVLCRRTQGIAGCENMARVAAHTESLRPRHSLQNRLQMLEPITKVRTLTRRRFQVDCDIRSGGSPVHFIERFSDSCQPGSLAFTHVRPGMDDQVRNPKGLTALDFNSHRVNRLLPKSLVRAGEIDKVGCVGNWISDGSLSKC